MKEVYLHIGMPKTGSSALQAFFSMNREKLEEKGIYYPLFDAKIVENRNMGVQGNAVLLEFLKKKNEQFNQQDISRLEAVKEVFSSYERILLSSETLWDCGSSGVLENIKNLASAYDGSVKIIVYIRRQDEWLESLWKQSVKSNFGRTKSCWDYCNDIIHKGGKQCDYCAILRDISDVIGKNNVYVRIYDAEMVALDKYSLYKDFLSIFNMEDISSFRFPEYKVNLALNRNMTEIKQAINGIPKSITLREEVNMIRNNTAFEEKESGDTDNASFLTYEQRKELLEFYEEGNKEIGREYFGIDDSPFSALRNEDENIEKRGGYQQLQDIAGFLGQILVSQSQEIEKLHYAVDEFELSKNIPKGSRIVVYGADRRARIIYHWLKRKQEYDAVGIVDKEFFKLNVLEPNVQAPEKLFKMEFDFVLIGVAARDTSEAIQRWLECNGMENEKIIRADMRKRG